MRSGKLLEGLGDEGAHDVEVVVPINRFALELFGKCVARKRLHSTGIVRAKVLAVALPRRSGFGHIGFVGVPLSRMELRIRRSVVSSLPSLPWFLTIVGELLVGFKGCYELVVDEAGVGMEVGVLWAYIYALAASLR